MHQLPRPRSKPAAAVPSAATDGRLIDRARAQDGYGQQRLGVDAASRAVEALQDPKMAAHSKEAIAKLNQIVQVCCCSNPPKLLSLTANARILLRIILSRQL
jgi:hypothetical protein